MEKRAICALSLVLLWAVGACTAQGPPVTVPQPTPTAVAGATTPAEAPPSVPTAEGNAPDLADVVSVEVTGEPGAYRFRVGVRSPDTGCDQYADWWEVVSEDGALLYRRVLLHSHVDEQPFQRTGSPVPISADQVVYVRAHLNPGGYGGAAFKGSPQAGFEAAELGAEFAAGLSNELPLPQGCAF